VTVVELFLKSANPNYIADLRQQSLNGCPEALICSCFGDDSNNRPVLSQHFRQFVLRAFDAPKILCDTHPTNMNVFPWVGILGSFCNETV